MIPAAFEYHAPTSIGEATALLARLGEDAKVLSGGQSLISGLAGIREADGFLRIGALTRESDLEGSELVRTRYPLLYETTKVIADPIVRNLATVGGNLAHADPAARRRPRPSPGPRRSSARTAPSKAGSVAPAPSRS